MDEKEFESLLYGYKNTGALFSELKGKQALLFVKGQALNEFALGLANAGTAAGYSGAYLSLNESFKSLADSFRQPATVGTQTYFIDCVSSTAGFSVLEKERCILVSSPTSLTELSLAITLALKKAGVLRKGAPRLNFSERLSCGLKLWI